MSFICRKVKRPSAICGEIAGKALHLRHLEGEQKAQKVFSPCTGLLLDPRIVESLLLQTVMCRLMDHKSSMLAGVVDAVRADASPAAQYQSFPSSSQVHLSFPSQLIYIYRACWCLCATEIVHSWREETFNVLGQGILRCICLSKSGDQSNALFTAATDGLPWRGVGRGG